MALTACADPGPIELDPAWSAIFDRTSGWVGADGASSVDLQDGRTLWLFGDSLVGSLKPDGGCAPGTTMVNNSIGVLTLSRHGAPPAPGDFVFVWGRTAEGAPAAWALSPAAIGEHAKDHWLWPAGGGIVAPSPAGGKRLVLFFMMMRRLDQSESIWNFQQHGCSIAVVDNPGRPPDQWRPVLTALVSCEKELDAKQSPRLINWGSAALPDPEAPPGAPRVLIFGADVTDVWHKRLVLARAPAASIERFDTWEFRTSAGWSPHAADVAPLAERLVDEFSVNRLRIAGGERYVLTQMEPDLGTHLQVRFAERPEGPWSDAVTIHACPEPGADKRSLVYSGKAHPELTGGDPLLLTYCVNSTDFWYMLAHAALYRPRVVRVPRDSLRGALDPGTAAASGRSPTP